MKKNKLSVIFTLALMCAACSDDGENGAKFPPFLGPVSDTSSSIPVTPISNYTYPRAGYGQDCLHEGISSSAYETEDFVVVTPKDNPSKDASMIRLAQLGQFEFDVLNNALGLARSELGIVDTESKLAICADTQLGSWDGHGDGKGLIYWAVDHNTPRDTKLGSGYRSTLRHELMHSIESRLAIRKSIINDGAERNNFEAVDEWFQEGLAEYVADRRYTASSIKDVDQTMADSSGFNPISFGRNADATASLDDYYKLYNLAVRFLLTPTQNGGAGNTIEDVIQLYKDMKIFSEDVNQMYKDNNDGKDIQHNIWGRGIDVFLDRIESVGRERKLAFEYAFDKNLKLNGKQLTFETFEMNFFKGERWFESMHTGEPVDY